MNGSNEVEFSERFIEGADGKIYLERIINGVRQVHLTHYKEIPYVTFPKNICSICKEPQCWGEYTHYETP